MWNLKPHKQTFPTVTLNLDGLFYILGMDHLLKNDFVSSFTGHMENSGSLSYADLLKVHTFHCAIYKKKITFDNITGL